MGNIMIKGKNLFKKVDCTFKVSKLIGDDGIVISNEFNRNIKENIPQGYSSYFILYCNIQYMYVKPSEKPWTVDLSMICKKN